jgi:hypothetical protein
MSIQFLNTGPMLRSGLCVLALGSGGAWALEERPYDFSDLIVGVSSSPVPKVKEDTTDGQGTTTHYEWGGTRSNGVAISLTGKQGTSLESQGGWEWGIGIVGSNYNITPTTYAVNGQNYANGSTSSLHYRSFGGHLLGGYEYGIVDMDEFRGIVEVGPYVGGGLISADNEVYSNNAYTKKNGFGAYVDFGAYLGAYITEAHWIYGLTCTYQASFGTVKMNMPGGYSSTMHFTSSGVGFGLAAGYRF